MAYVDPIKRLVELVDVGEKRGSQREPSICMVPGIYRDQNPKCFDPRVVSIGPIHRGHKNVQEHEGLKGVYMHDLLVRLKSLPTQSILARFSSSQTQILKTCYNKVRERINEIKSCYAWKDMYHAAHSDDDIINMMVTDACFILEFIQKMSDSDTFLFSGNLFTRTNILRDLILIENQIPFFVLQDIFDLTLSKIQQNKDIPLNILLLKHVLSPLNPFNYAQLRIHNDISHILDFLHKSFRLPDIPYETEKNPQLPIRRCRSAIELDRSGLKFKPNNRYTNWALEMKFESSSLCWPFRPLGPTLRMPILYIDDKTELLFRNLIAYEQSYPNLDRHYFTSFAVAMDMLVDSTEDVIKLVESEVIVNDLGSNEIAANMINSIANEVVNVPFIYIKQWENLDDYYKSYWPKNIAWLRRKYFGSPWSVIALVAALIIFALTTISTYFTVWPPA